MTQYYTIKTGDFTTEPLTYTETVETIRDWFLLETAVEAVFEAEYGGSSAEEAYNVRQAVESVAPIPEEELFDALPRLQSYALMVSFAVSKALGRDHIPHYKRYKEGLLLLVNLSP